MCLIFSISDGNLISINKRTKQFLIAMTCSILVIKSVEAQYVNRMDLFYLMLVIVIKADNLK